MSITIVVGVAAERAAVREEREGATRCAFDPALAVDEDAATARLAGAVSSATHVAVVGFPRSPAQAAALVAALQRRALKIERVVLADADDADVVRDRALRRACPACGARFHLDDAPPADVDVCDRCRHEGLALLDEDTPGRVKRALPEERAAALAILGVLRADGAAGVVSGELYFDEAELRAADALQRAQSALLAVKQRVAVDVADEKRLARLVETERALALDWQGKAELAVTAGADDVARQALLRADEHARQAAQHAQRQAAQAAQLALGRAELARVTAQLERLHGERKQLAARANVARARRTIAELCDAVDSPEAHQAVARLQRVVERAERAAQVLWELATHGRA